MATKEAVSAPIPTNNRERMVVSAASVGNTTPFVTDWQRFVDTDVCVQLSGTATSVTAVVERSAVDPDKGTASPAPADASGFSGSLVTGIPGNIYSEPGVGWWRVNVSAVSGGNCTAALSGKS